MIRIRRALGIFTVSSLVVLIGSLAAPGLAGDEPLTPPADVPPATGPLDWHPGEVVVKFSENVLSTDLPPQWRRVLSTGVPKFDRLAADFGFEQVRRYFGAFKPQRPGPLAVDRIAIFRFPEELDVEQLLVAAEVFQNRLLALAVGQVLPLAIG